MTVRRALLVGIDHYTSQSPLYTAVNGALAVGDALRTHEDGTSNYTVNTLVSEEGTNISRQKLMEGLGDLFAAGKGSELLFYFAGHGQLTDLGPELVTEEATGEISGVSLDQIAAAANRLELRSLTIILDCCKAGGIGELVPLAPSLAMVQLSRGSALLAAASEEGNAYEVAGQSWFTSAIVEGLLGAAADIHGRVTPVGLHYLAETTLIGTQQEPILKVYSDPAIVLRNCPPTLTHDQLHVLASIFGDDEEPAMVGRSLSSALVGPKAVDPETASVQALVRHGLISAARTSPTGETVQLELTRRGRHYWRLALDGVFDPKKKPAAP